jgi:hypothetical protein
MALNIILFNTQINKLEKLNNVVATTWGELKSKISNYDSNMKAMIKENKMTLENDGAILPIGIGKDSSGNSNGTDFTLFLTPTKVKSGNELLDYIDILTANLKEDLDSLLKEELDTYKNNVVKAIESFIDEVPKTNIDIEENALRQEAQKLTN